jgi:hypothetical protein
MNLLLNLMQINMCDNSIFPIKDSSQLLESRPPSLDVEEVNKEEFNKDPDSVDERQVPVVRQVLPSNGVGVAK